MPISKTISQLINDTDGFIYLCRCLRPMGLIAPNEYYIQVVTDRDYPANKSQHVKWFDPHTHEYYVGIERPNEQMGYYISKDFYKRNARGIVCLVEVPEESLKDYTII